MLEQWMTSEYAIRLDNNTKVLTLAALIPPSAVEVERTFSLIQLICPWTRKEH